MSALVGSCRNTPGSGQGACTQRGDAHERSDVDLLVVETEPFGRNRSRHEETNRLRRVVRRFGVPVDVLVFRVDEVEYWRDSLNHVVGRAQRKGRVLHQRAESRGNTGDAASDGARERQLP